MPGRLITMSLPCRVTSEFATPRPLTLIGSDETAISPFLLKKDAADYAAKNGGRVLSFEDAVKAAVSGG